MRDRQNRVFVRVGTLKQSTLKKRYKFKVKKKILLLTGRFRLNFLGQVSTSCGWQNHFTFVIIHPDIVSHIIYNQLCTISYVQSVMYNRFVFQVFRTRKSFNKRFTNFKIVFSKHLLFHTLPNLTLRKNIIKNNYLLG